MPIGYSFKLKDMKTLKSIISNISSLNILIVLDKKMSEWWCVLPFIGKVCYLLQLIFLSNALVIDILLFKEMLFLFLIINMAYSIFHNIILLIFD